MRRNILLKKILCQASVGKRLVASRCRHVLRRQAVCTLRLAASASVLVFAAGCGGQSLAISIDGSSTVFPVTEAVAEEFRNVAPEVHVTVGVSGTGGGFKKFSAGETDISDASRQIKDSEREACEKNGIEFIELQVAYDGLAVLVNPANDWVDCITVEQLKKTWEPESPVKKWSDIDPSWPNEPIALYGPGTDSGTFDYFTEAIVGEEKASRSDYTASEDDNVLVRGIAADKYALGYFGYAYFDENKDKLKLLAVDGGKGCITPSTETVLNGEYAPLSRPLFLYISKSALKRPEVKKFVDFYVDNAQTLVPEIGYVPVPAEQLAANRSLVASAVGAE